MYITAIIGVKVLAVGLFLSFYQPEKFYLLCKTAIILNKSLTAYKRA